MRIRRLKLDGFGCLQGEYSFSGDGCNLVVESNEAGKSTLIQAILAALYGLSPAERDAYRPWSGGSYRIEAELETSRGPLVIQRDLEADSVAVRDLGSGEELTAELAPDSGDTTPGEKLCGLNRDDFTKTAFVLQQELDSIHGTRSLTHRLQRMADTESSGTTAGQALAMMEESLACYDGLLARGETVDDEERELEAARTEARESYVRLGEQRVESERRLAAFDAEHTDMRELGHQMEQLEFLLLRAEHSELSRDLDAARKRQSELERYSAELDQLADAAPFSATDLGRLMQMKDSRIGMQRSLEELRKAYEIDIRQPTRLVVEELKPLQHLKPLSREDLTLLQGMAVHMRQAQQELDLVDRQIDKETQRLRDQGRNVEEIDRQIRGLAQLTDEQRGFLGRAREDRIQRQARLTGLEKDVAREQARIEESTVRRGGQRKWSLALVGLGAIAAAPGGFLVWSAVAATQQTLGAVLLGAGVVGLLIGIAMLTVSTRSDPRSNDAEARVREMESERKKLRSAHDEEEQQLSAVAQSVGSAGPDALLEAFRGITEVNRDLAELERIRSSRASIERDLSGLRNDIASVIERCPGEPLMEDMDLKMVLRFAASLEKFHALNDRLHLLQEMASRQTAEAQRLETQLREVDATIEQIYDNAGIAADTPLDETIEHFRKQVPRKERYELLNNELIPRIEQEIPETKELDQSARKLEILDKRINERTQQTPEFEALEITAPSREYAEQWRELSERSKELSQRRFELRSELAETLHRYRSQVPQLRAREEALTGELDRLHRYRSSIQHACEVLGELSRDTYRQWADGLNIGANEVLLRLNPDYRDIRFDEELGFTLATADGRAPASADLVESLSSGVRDQIYLAVRIAVSQYLSGGTVRLPIILDDPFVSFDDARFEQSMSYIVTELTREHQVILLSCHEQRHRAWEERNPEQNGQHVQRCRLLRSEVA